jgi:hypothetical protein
MKFYRHRLSASASASFSSLIPPPTVNGMLISRAMRFHQIHKGFAAFVRGGNVEENQFVGTLFGIQRAQFHGIAHGFNPTKLMPFTV